jgi:hypothetical protein
MIYKVIFLYLADYITKYMYSADKITFVGIDI